MVLIESESARITIPPARLSRCAQGSIMTLRDWFTTSMAVAAFVMSAVSFYFSVLWKSDNLLVVVGDTPAFSVSFEKNVIMPSNVQTMALINSGNRAAAVIRIRLFLEETNKSLDDATSCPKYGDHVLTADYEFEPLVIKPGDMSTLKAQLPTAERGKPEPTLNLSAESKTAQRVKLFGCLRFTVVTPDNVSEESDVPFFLMDIPRNEITDDFGHAILPARIPRVLRRNAWPAFSW